MRVPGSCTESLGLQQVRDGVRLARAPHSSRSARRCPEHFQFCSSALGSDAAEDSWPGRRALQAAGGPGSLLFGRGMASLIEREGKLARLAPFPSANPKLISEASRASSFIKQRGKGGPRAPGNRGLEEPLHPIVSLPRTVGGIPVPTTGGRM